MSFAFKPSALLAIAASACAACGSQPPVAAEAPTHEGAEEKKPVDPRYVSLPEPKPTPKWAPPPATKRTMDNGLSVWQMNAERAPLVSIYLMLPTGGATDPEGKAGLSLLTVDLLDEGAGPYSALELSDRFGELATDYSAQAGVDYVLLSMDALTENLDESLALLADIVLRPRLSKDEFERRKRHHLATALASRDDPGSSRSKAIDRVLFSDGYAGAPPEGTVESLEAITFADVRRHAKRMTVPEQAHLAVAGMFDPEELRAAVEREFGDWKGKLETTNSKVQPPPKGKNAYVVDFPGAAQSALAVVTVTGSDETSDYFAEEVMNEKLGHSFTSRINMNLREDKGFTYGAFSRFRRYRKAGYFAVMSNVKTETTGPSVKEIYSEFSAVCKNRPFTDTERNEAVEGLLLGLPMQFDQVGALGFRLVSLPVHNRPADFWKTWPREIKNVTTQMVNAAAKPLCNTSRYSVIVAGDKSAVSTDLKRLGFSLVELDRDGRVKDEERADDAR